MSDQEIIQKSGEESKEQSYLEIEETFGRFHLLAKKLARQQAASSPGDPVDNREELEQLAAVGLLEALHKHGKDVSPLQVQDFIREQFRQHVIQEIKAKPWLRSTCPECGSTSARECEHKRALRKSGADKPQYAFGKTEHGQVNLDWEHSSYEGEGITYDETIADKSDSFRTERELQLERIKHIAQSALHKLPSRYGTILYMRSLLYRDGNPATWEEIAKAAKLARATVIRRHQEAMVWLRGIAKGERPRTSKGKEGRLCTMYPTYRRGQRLPWSQDPKFSLSVIPFYRGADLLPEVIEAERREQYSDCAVTPTTPNIQKCEHGVYDPQGDGHWCGVCNPTIFTREQIAKVKINHDGWSVCFLKSGQVPKAETPKYTIPEDTEPEDTDSEDTDSESETPETELVCQ